MRNQICHFPETCCRSSFTMGVTRVADIIAITGSEANEGGPCTFTGQVQLVITVDDGRRE